MGKRGGGGVPGRDPVERFMSFTKIASDIRLGMETPCLEWQGCKNSKGYGQFAFGGKGKTVLSHRWAYEHIGGETIPEDMTIDHRCRNIVCVNTGHLRVLSRGANVLAGESFSAKNAQKTHCVHGHALAGDNAYVDVRGKRVCRTCRRDERRRWEARRKMAS